MRSLKPDLNTSKDLSGGALSYSYTIVKACKLDNIRLHASVGITETITVTITPKIGSNYGTIESSIGLVAQQDYVWRPQGEENLQVGDVIKVQCTNANLTGIVYVTIKLSELGA